MHEFRSYRGFSAPWNRRLKLAFNLNPVPEWVEDETSTSNTTCAMPRCPGRAASASWASWSAGCRARRWT